MLFREGGRATGRRHCRREARESMASRQRRTGTHWAEDGAGKGADSVRTRMQEQLAGKAKWKKTGRKV